MDCFICGADTSEGEIFGDCRHMDCPDCGRYMVSGSMERKLEDRSLNVEMAREKLSRRRRKGEAPLLTTYDDDLLS